MRDIFYNTIYEVGSIKWKKSLSSTEYNEWDWILKNQNIIGKHQEEIGIEQTLYLGRLLFSLFNSHLFEENTKFISKEKLVYFIKIEDEIDNIKKISRSELRIENIISALAKLSLKDKAILLELGIDKVEIISKIQYYQKLLDKNGLETFLYTDTLNTSYKDIVLHRSGLVFYQLAKEGIKAKISITHIYKLYNQYSFIKYLNIENVANWNHEHPIFKIIKQQRRSALNQYESRLKKLIT